MDLPDIHLLSELENGLPLVEEPYEEIGKRLNLTGSEVLERIQKLRSAGIIRKFRARINQRRVGITANALVAWKRADSPKGEMGPLLASFPCVTHCYERLPVPGRWEYTIYTVHHGYSRDAVLAESGHLPTTSAFMIMSSCSVPKSSNASRMSVSGRMGVLRP